MTGTAHPPEPDGWISAAEAAERLGRAVRYVATGHTSGRFPVTRHDGESWLRETDVDRIIEERRLEEERWVTRPIVEEWAGCSDGPLVAAIQAGLIKLRPGPRTRGMPSLERESARAWANQKRKASAERARRDAEREALASPPDDEHVWLDTSTSAVIVGIKPRKLLRLAQLSRAPATKQGRRWWWRRDLVEAFAAARVATTKQTMTSAHSRKSVEGTSCHNVPAAPLRSPP